MWEDSWKNSKKSISERIAVVGLQDYGPEGPDLLFLRNFQNFHFRYLLWLELVSQSSQRMKIFTT